MSEPQRAAPLIAGGYWLVAAAARPAYAAHPALPAQLWTPTACLCGLHPDYWAFSWGNADDSIVNAALANLGIGRDALPALQRWMDAQLEAGGVGFPGPLLRYDAAREFEARFVRGSAALRLLGLGLPEAHVDTFLEEARPEPGMGAPGLYRAIEARRRLEPGGALLGYEPLCYDHGGFHSYLCNSLQHDYTGKLGLAINEHGRFDDLAACERAVTYTRLDTTGAEPGLWQPWAVVGYERAPGH